MSFISGTTFIKDNDEKYRHYGISFEKRLVNTGGFIKMSDGEQYFIQILLVSKEIKEEIKEKGGIVKSIYRLKSGAGWESEFIKPIGRP